MKLIIDTPEDEYDCIRWSHRCNEPLDIAHKCIALGTPVVEDEEKEEEEEINITNSEVASALAQEEDLGEEVDE